MAGYVLHLEHVLRVWMNLSEQTKKQMPQNALRSMLLGAIVPDLTTSKDNTHFYVPHPEFGKYYMIPDQAKVEELFLKKDPTSLGVLAHLTYDNDSVCGFLLRYGKPTKDGMFENTRTGKKISGMQLFGDWKTTIGQLYKFYNKTNAMLAKELAMSLTVEMGIYAEANKEGLLNQLKQIFPDGVPLCGIPEMDNFRSDANFHDIIKGYFDDDGHDCTWDVQVSDLIDVNKESAARLARKINALYTA